MKRMLVCAVLAELAAVSLIHAQTPTGTISGAVQDPSGGFVQNAAVVITDKATGLIRTVHTQSSGEFGSPALPPGLYQIEISSPGFRTLSEDAAVEAGTVTSINAHLELGESKTVISVTGVAPMIEYERHSIDGVVTRRQIEDLPLNGRSFLQLAFLQPGVTVNPASTSQYNALMSVSILGGSSDRTAITMDGGDIRNSLDGGTGTNFSQEVIQEFQLSSVNFDLSTPITSVGAVNVVTRSGSNNFHGAGYFYFRDHHLSAYPGLARDPLAPDPFFARRNPGFWIGGPMIKNKLFFFFNLETMNQASLAVVHPDDPFFLPLSQTASSPYRGKTLSARFDYRPNDRNSLFVRYSHDGNNSFGPRTLPTLPSNWLKNSNWSDQSLLDYTGIVTPNLVNDFRFSYWYWRNRNLVPDAQDCPNCIGLGMPEMTVYGTNVTFGNTQNAPQGRDLRRYNWNDNMTWQRGSHRIKFGGQFEHTVGTGFWAYADPASGVIYSPEIVGHYNSLVPPSFRINIPAQFQTTQDLLALPLASFAMGIGDPQQPPPYNFNQAKQNNTVHVFAQDTWRVHPKFTLNYGLAWSFETNLVNHDLSKPAYLAPVYGSDLRATGNNYKNFSPALGFAWNVGDDNKTVIRAGAGIYYDTQLLFERLQERSYIGPLGNGRILVYGTSVPNPIPGIIDVPLGRALDFQTGPTHFTLGHLEAILPAISAGATAQFAAEAEQAKALGITTIQVAKAGTQLIPRNYPIMYSEHASIGVQRQISSDLVVSGDFVFRQAQHVVFDNPVDYNRYQRRINGVQTPVIPICTPAQATNPVARCSTGEIDFWTPGGRSNYKALLLRVDKRFSRRFQFTAAYALQSQYGVNGFTNVIGGNLGTISSSRTVGDLNNWYSTWGPQLPHQTLNISGVLDLPWKFQISFLSQIISRMPVEPYIANVDLNGNGATNQPLPGAAYNGFNVGLGKSDLVQLVNQFNQNYAGKTDAWGRPIPSITLPANYQLGHMFASQDVRLGRSFVWKERVRLNTFIEGFNIFNVANLTGYSYNLLDPGFGAPTSRVQQTFGSGGPRAFQLGARLSF